MCGMIKIYQQIKERVMNNLLAVNMPVIVDVVAIVFVAAFMIYGYAKGFVKQFVSAFGTIFSLLFAVLLCTSVANFLQTQFGLVESLAVGLDGVLTNIVGADVMEITLGEAGREYLAQQGMAAWMIDLVMLFVADGSLPLDTSLRQVIGPTFAYYLLIILSAVGLFIIFKLLFFLLGKIIKKLHSIRLIAILDNGLGCLLGLFSGIIYLELIIMVISIIPIQAVQDVYMAIQSSIFASFVARINLYNVVLNAISSTNVVGYVKNLVINSLPI